MAKKKEKSTNTISDVLTQIGNEMLQQTPSVNEVYLTAAGRVFATEEAALAAVEKSNDKTIVKISRNEQTDNKKN